MITRNALATRDNADPLAHFRDEFVLPDGVVYLDGNSLGPLPRAAPKRLAAVIRQEWGEDLIRSWNSHDWIGMPTRVGDKIGRLIGAGPGQVVAADSTSVNLFKLLAAALVLRPDRRIIVTERTNFPADLYIAQGLVQQLGDDYEIRFADPDDVAASFSDEVAVVMLTQVDYRSARIHNMAAIAAVAHRHGALMLWDLAHSAGAIPVNLDASNADLAVGCGYKYLNGGPGAPAFAYIATRLQDRVEPLLSGWMGHAAPFDFTPDYRPAPGIKRLLCGTPPVLSMAALEVGIDLMLQARMGRIRDKSIALTDAFIALVDQECGDFGFTLASPREPTQRGSQVSLRHPHGYAIMRALIERGVIGDYRMPDILRFGFCPMYLRHVDVWDAVAALRDIMTTAAWDRPEFQVRAAVT